MKTEKNLADGFAGESQANLKYLAFAKTAAILAPERVKTNTNQSGVLQIIECF